MLGSAKKLFLEKGAAKERGWDKDRHCPWQKIESLLNSRCLAYVDFALAERLLHGLLKTKPLISEKTEAMAAFICHLSMASRLGHLCITIDQKSVFPSPEMIWLSTSDAADENGQMTAKEAFELEALIIEGAFSLPPSLLFDAATESKDQNTDLQAAVPLLPICKQENRYYLQRFFILETLFLSHLSTRLKGNLQTPFVDGILVKQQVDALSFSGRLLPEQAEAILQGCLNPLTLITGGPGTGKTYTAGMLIRVLLQCMSDQEISECSIALAAPTGKAAANLEASIRSALAGVEYLEIPVAKTLHGLLGIGRHVVIGSSSVLPHDIVLVDESSMIDIRLMERLLGSMKPGARLIMLGDRFQLPPIEAGSLFADMVSALQNDPLKKQCVAELKTCLRAELKAIIDVASHINSGNEQKVMETFQEASTGSPIRFHPFKKSDHARRQKSSLLAYCRDKFTHVDKMPDNPMELLEVFSRFRILTPLRKGPLGVESLNAHFFQEAMNRARASGSSLLISPIMVIQNDHRLGLFNGEVGLLVREIRGPHIFGDLSSRGFALFSSKSDPVEGVRKISLLMMPNYEYAYCLSVHKSQGSEFDHVLMLLPQGSERFGREVLYTGVTRARKSLEIWADPDVFKAALNQVSRRHSGILERYHRLGIVQK